ncbi:ABC transporter substrate-binding protein [Micromonospora sp. NBC_01813]|uniref:ABC transporter substrate-binding protein n=1 Tax=Micromonospora sp. NBC_01813 TaxID=2975988 RepID=UPI002DDB5091|nr:ABC transporter substrate-binding protein [Micromonospora sp. NBC_01813]WSA09204.1 ABC transporter substrate-binding protein [Micromonospora sp. NBC_01813]
MRTALHRRIAPLAALALTGLLVTTGCGADAAAADNDGYTLRIGAIGNANKLSGPVGWLHERGELVPALAEAGVGDVSVVTFPNGPDLNQALAAGELDLAVYGDTPALVARGANQPTRLIAQASVNLDAGIVTKASDGPTSIADLAGRKLAVQTGSYIHRYLLGALADANVEPAEILHVYASEVEAALERGDVDAAAVPAANVEFLRARGYPVLTVASADHRQYLGTSATVVTENFLDARPEIVPAWQRVQRSAAEQAANDWEGFLDYTISINGFPPEVVRATTLPEQWPTEAFTEEGLELLHGTKEFLTDQEFLRDDFELDEWIAPGAR